MLNRSAFLCLFISLLICCLCRHLFTNVRFIIVHVGWDSKHKKKHYHRGPQEVAKEIKFHILLRLQGEKVWDIKTLIKFKNNKTYIIRICIYSRWNICVYLCLLFFSLLQPAPIKMMKEYNYISNGYLQQTLKKKASTSFKRCTLKHSM